MDSSRSTKETRMDRQGDRWMEGKDGWVVDTTKRTEMNMFIQNNTIPGRHWHAGTRREIQKKQNQDQQPSPFALPFSIRGAHKRSTGMYCSEFSTRRMKGGVCVRL